MCVKRWFKKVEGGGGGGMFSDEAWVVCQGVIRGQGRDVLGARLAAFLVVLMWVSRCDRGQGGGGGEMCLNHVSLL